MSNSLSSEVVVARYAVPGAVIAQSLGVGFALALLCWLVVASESPMSLLTLVLVALTSMTLVYYLWRFAKVLYAVNFGARRAITLREEWVYGLANRKLGSSEIVSLQLRVNEAGRPVLLARLASGATVRTPLSGLEPAPSEIVRLLTEALPNCRAI